MPAAIDVGSNTVRMLIGDCHDRRLRPVAYYRRITRLGGRYQEGEGLAPDSMERTLSALEDFSRILQEQAITRVRAVATAALRRAENRQLFLLQTAARTSFNLDIIAGDEEAVLTARGVLSVLNPVPETALIVDIGGGSTELILTKAGQILFRRSYPIGVVRLCEEFKSDRERQLFITQTLDDFLQDVRLGELAGMLSESTQLIGTAGTVTTLAAIFQRMTAYDRHKINNSILSHDWLREIGKLLLPLSVPERERFPGLEEGRGDLILPGLQLLISLMEKGCWKTLKVADSGLLEGVLLGICED